MLSLAVLGLTPTAALESPLGRSHARTAEQEVGNAAETVPKALTSLARMKEHQCVRSPNRETRASGVARVKLETEVRVVAQGERQGPSYT